MKAAIGARAGVVAVVGLAAEARLLAGADARVLAGGGDATALAAAIEREIAAGASAVISFGMAGALAASLRPGTMVIADRVCDGEDRLEADARWVARLRSRLPSAVVGAVAGSDHIVGDARAKAAWHAHTGALAVDMESHVAARIAARHKLPFVALRAIADAADRHVPPAARVAMRPGGGVDVGAVVRSLVRAPGQIPALIGIARDARVALRALARRHRAPARRLGYADLDELSLHVV